MTVEISAEDHNHLQRCVALGQFSSMEEALHHSVQSLISDVADEEDYRSYVLQRIESGLADVEAGRVIPAEQVMDRLRARLSR